MAIKFVCSCGKRLRARDEMAARRSVCPACGEPVGIPSLTPTARGATAGPMTPAERLSARRRVLAPDSELPGTPKERPGDELRIELPPNTPATAAEPTVDQVAQMLLSTLQHDLAPPPLPASKRGEYRWFCTFLFPFQAAIPVLFHGLTLTVPVLVTFALARMLAENQSAGVGEVLTVAAFYSLLPLAIAGGACSFLDSVLAAPPTRDAAKLLLQPSREIGPALRSSLVWVACFLAGPVLPAGLAFANWLYGGYTVVDRLIEVELCSVAVSYWLFALICVHERDQLRDLNPIRVADLVHRLGFRAVILAALASAIAIVHGAIILSEPGWMPTAGVSLSSMLCATFLFRLAGVWCQRKSV